MRLSITLPLIGEATSVAVDLFILAIFVLLASHSTNVNTASPTGEGTVVRGNVNSQLPSEMFAMRAVELRPLVSSGSSTAARAAATVAAIASTTGGVTTSTVVPEALDVSELLLIFLVSVDTGDTNVSGVLVLLQESRDVIGNPRDQVHQLSVGAKLGPILHLHQLGQAGVYLLQPQQDDEVVLGERHVVSMGPGLKASGIDVGADQVLGEEVQNPFIKDVQILVLGHFDGGASEGVQQAVAIQLEVEDDKDDLSH